MIYVFFKDEDVKVAIASSAQEAYNKIEEDLNDYEVKTVKVKPDRDYFYIVSDSCESVDDVKVIGVDKGIYDEEKIKEKYAIEKSYNPLFRHYVDELAVNSGLLGKFFDEELIENADTEYVNRVLKNRMYKYFKKNKEYAKAYYDYWLNNKERENSFSDEFYEFVCKKEIMAGRHEFIEVNKITI